MPAVDVSIVTFRPDYALLCTLLESVAEQVEGLGASLYVHDNSPDPGVAAPDAVVHREPPKELCADLGRSSAALAGAQDDRFHPFGSFPVDADAA